MNMDLRIEQAERQAQAGMSHHETADAYSRVLIRRGRYRVAACRDNIQWLFQRRRHDIQAGGTAWDTLGYCVTQKALTRLTRLHSGRAWPELAAFHATFKREDRT